MAEIVFFLMDGTPKEKVKEQGRVGGRDGLIEKKRYSDGLEDLGLISLFLFSAALSALSRQPF